MWGQRAVARAAARRTPMGRPFLHSAGLPNRIQDATSTYDWPEASGPPLSWFTGAAARRF
eukprot:167873-Pyramimonas_sp.AAC.1